MVATLRRGTSTLGCLVSLLIVATAGYFATKAGETYLRYFRFRDRMDQAARFAPHTTDVVIRRDLRSFADSIGLPDGARNVIVRRQRGIIAISSNYYDQIEMPWFVREVGLNAHVERPL